MNLFLIPCSIANDSVTQFITVTLVFVFVLAITYFTTRFVGSYQKKQMSHGNIKVIESLRIANNKVIEIVKAGDKCYMIAVCKDTVTCIGEVNEDTLDLKPEEKRESFGNVFSRFRVMHKNETGNEAEDDEQ